MRYEPLYDRILVRPIKADGMTKGGLYVPDIVADGSPWYRGEVVAVGHGRICSGGETVPLMIKTGDVVCFFRHPPEQMVFPDEDGADLLCIREPHVMAVLHDLPRPTGIVSVEGTELLAQPPSQGDAS